MNKKGFGKSQPTKLQMLLSEVVNYCRCQSPESLDRIFDTLPNGLTEAQFTVLNKQLIQGIVEALIHDVDTLAWFCSYTASEINCSEDNDKYHPIKLLSKLLIKSGMIPFADFSPYPGCRIVILNADKFGLLPERVKKLLQDSFDLTETTGEDAQRINNALLSELIVLE
jgi:hypothetical protein